ncbi:MAG: hypothetical protein ACK4F0_08320 [Candidatus Ratteibacteria bacterium]
MKILYDLSIRNDLRELKLFLTGLYNAMSGIISKEGFYEFKQFLEDLENG